MRARSVMTGALRGCGRARRRRTAPSGVGPGCV